MPKTSKPLTAKEVAAISRPGMHSIGGVQGLYLQIRESGNKYFTLRYRTQLGERKVFSIGACPPLTLKDARDIANDLLRKIAGGFDPVEEKRQQKNRRQDEEKQATIERLQQERTVERLADEWISERSLAGYWANNTRGESVARAYFRNHINPVIGDVPITELTSQQVFTMLKPIWQTTTDTGENCKACVFQLFRWAKAKGYCTHDNPADIKGVLGVLLEPLEPGRIKQKHYPALPFEEVPAFIRLLLKNGSLSYLMVAFSILTALRSKMVRLAKWSDLNLEEKTLTIPNSSFKTKGRGDHTVYLSEEAIHILSRIPRKDNVFIFTTPNSRRPFSDAAMSVVFKRMHTARFAIDGTGWVDPIQTKKEGRPMIATQHGTARASFKTWCSTGENRRRLDVDAVELCLAHKLQDDYDGAYNRAHLKEERIEVMNAWGKYCFSEIPEN